MLFFPDDYYYYCCRLGNIIVINNVAIVINNNNTVLVSIFGGCFRPFVCWERFGEEMQRCSEHEVNVTVPKTRHVTK